MTGDSTVSKAKSSNVTQLQNHQAALLISTFILGLMLRVYHVERSSLWYDEVVTMKLARTANRAALLKLLPQIDATCAPLHPIILQGWLRLFGCSDYSGRAFSILCGMLTIGLVYFIGVQVMDARGALWASWLCTLSPLLIYYSREARMYMWLVMLTCLAWGFLLSRLHSLQHWRLVIYGFSLVAIVYSHPLGLLMVTALAVTAAIFRQAFRLSWRTWLCIHLATALATFPWLRHYLDHTPESISGLLSVRYLLGAPIGFIGGNSSSLFVCLLLIGYGQCQIDQATCNWPRVIFKPRTASLCLLIWLILPPVILYLYSYLGYPIFGPSRYTLFIGPAYLLLIAQGLAKLHWPFNFITGTFAVYLSATVLFHDVYRVNRYADWRRTAAYLNQHDRGTPVVILTAGPFPNTEIETARYYFGPSRIVTLWVNSTTDLISYVGPIWLSADVQAGQYTDNLPDTLATEGVIEEILEFPGIQLLKFNFPHSRKTHR